MHELFVLINDSIVPASKASLLVSDLSIQRGYGVFDFFKTVDHTPVFVSDHLDRFLHSAARLRLPLAKNREQLMDMIGHLQHKNNLPHSGIRLTLTGGYAADGYTLSRPNLVITQQPLQLPAQETFEKGIRLVTYPHQRQLPEVKSIDYLMAIWLQPYIRERQADDVLYHHEGVVSECPRANFFLVTRENKIITPASHILKGIIRSKVLSLAGKTFQIEEQPVRLEELRTAREAFITSTTKHVMPVVRIGGRLIGEGVPGEITQTLATAINRLVHQF